MWQFAMSHPYLFTFIIICLLDVIYSSIKICKLGKDYDEKEDDLNEKSNNIRE